MGITIVHKSDDAVLTRKPRTALVLAGGAVSGGAFKLGGLIALNNYLKNRKVTDFDMYVGMSAGALLSGPLSAGMPPEEILKSLHGRSRKLTRLSFLDFYYPNWRGATAKLRKLAHDALSFYPGVSRGVFDYFRKNYKQVLGQLQDYASDPGLEALEEILRPIMRAAGDSTDLPNLSTYIPGGVFDSSHLERYVRLNLERNRLPNSFRLLRHVRRRDLYIGATSLDSAAEVVFGPDERCDLTISEAVQASCSVPVFYRPARIHGEDFLDANVVKTANVTLAAAKGADLIICYNPFRPFHHTESRQLIPGFKHMGDLGVLAVINQTVRTLLHSRLSIGIEAIRHDPSFRGDLILIEPLESDAEFFTMNPIAFWRLAAASERGFATASQIFSENHRELKDVFQRYGIDVDLNALQQSGERLSEARFDDRQVLDLLEQPSIPRRVKAD